MAIISKVLRGAEQVIFHARLLVIALILAGVVFFAMQIPGLRMYSDFSDLLPQEHPYVKLHNEIRDSFGGANIVILSVSVDEGTIFDNETLDLVHELTQAVDSLPGINHNLVTSLTHRSMRRTRLTEVGSVESIPYYDPLKEGYSEAELAQMRSDVLANPGVYGLFVSPDMKSALIKGALNEGRLDYEATFKQLRGAIEAAERPGVSIYATGQPVLVGWVYSYVGQIFQIFMITGVIMISLLIVYFRNFYGVLLPLLAVSVTGVWGLGTIALLGYNLDPLTLVVPFLISARALSHGIQLVERYYAELDDAPTGAIAAQRAFEALFRPGSLGVLSDAIGIFLISLGAIPLNTKLAYYGSIWSASVIVTVLILVPVVLSFLPKPKVTELPRSFLRKIAPFYGRFVSSRVVAGGILVAAAAAYVGGGYMASFVQIGEQEPGSPLLYHDHDYNVSSKAINDSFPGSEELFVIATTQEERGLKRPEVLRAIQSFQAHMMLDPELGGTKALPQLVSRMYRLQYYDDPRWLQIPDDPRITGGLMFAYMTASPIPGALDEFVTPDEQNANIVFYFKDHKGETIRRAVHRLKQWIDDPANQVEGLEFRLAGGIIGVTAASNQSAFETNRLVVPLVLGLIVIFLTLFYRSLHAGWLMFLAMSFAVTLSYAYMGWRNIGINVNTVPILAVGIGVGIDYSIYIMDRVREEMRRHADLTIAVKRAISTTGLAVCFTAMTLVAGVIMWVFLSDLRFQADAALLLCVMIGLNAIAALALVPAWIILVKPKFLMRETSSQ